MRPVLRMIRRINLPCTSAAARIFLLAWYHRYYLEFEVEMPDELFRGEAVDLKNFWTQF